MRTRYRVRDDAMPYFVTSTVVAWLQVFTTAARCDILVQSIQFCREQKGLKLYAWVLLDNHFQAIVAAPNLARVMADLKKYTAGRILEELQAERCDWLLNQLAFFRARHKTASTHQVWQEGYHPQVLASDQMMGQKIEYLHNNPVRRGLVATAEHWRYSSAHERLPAAQQVMRCDPWR